MEKRDYRDRHLEKGGERTDESCGLVLQLFHEVLQETAPSWGGAQLGDVIDVHLDAFVSEHDKAAAWDVVNVV